MTLQNMKTLRDLSRELDRLHYVNNDPRVYAAIELVRKERAPQIEALRDQITKLRAKRPEKKPRWSDNTPRAVLDTCAKYWQGTTEYYTFRIHCWNSKGVCTSYPSGGYSDNGGWHPTSASFHFISLIDKQYSKPKGIGKYLEGRQSAKQLALKLAEYTVLG